MVPPIASHPHALRLPLCIRHAGREAVPPPPTSWLSRLAARLRTLQPLRIGKPMPPPLPLESFQLESSCRLAPPHCFTAVRQCARMHCVAPLCCSRQPHGALLPHAFLEAALGAVRGRWHAAEPDGQGGHRRAARGVQDDAGGQVECRLAANKLIGSSEECAHCCRPPLSQCTL